jgi:hypothetical protein
VSGTLIVAVVAVGLSAASIAWQASTFVLSGARVRVGLRHGGLDVKSGRSVLLEFPRRRNRERVIDDPSYIDVFAIAVTSSGRTDVDIVSWGFEFMLDTSVWLHGADGGLNLTLPHRLRHGSQCALYLTDEDVQSAVDAVVAPGAVRVRGWVSLGNGKNVYTAPVVLDKSPP